MKPTLVQRFFANNCPLWIMVGGGVVGCMGLTGLMYFPALQMRIGSIAWLVFLVLVAGVLGFFIGFLAAAILLPPIYWLRDICSGAPYNIGEEVCVLFGEHRGRVVRVYEIWRFRRQVRVELSEGEAAMFQDLFMYKEVIRHTPDDKTATAG